jgi:hypothetical protein
MKASPLKDILPITDVADASFGIRPAAAPVAVEVSMPDMLPEGILPTVAGVARPNILSNTGLSRAAARTLLLRIFSAPPARGARACVLVFISLMPPTR